MRSTLYLDSTVSSQPRQGVVANTVKSYRAGAAGLIDESEACRLFAAIAGEKIDDSNTDNSERPLDFARHETQATAA